MQQSRPRVHVVNADYVAAHGQTPRGRGLWFFDLIFHGAARVTVTHRFTGTYSDGVGAMKRIASASAATSVSVRVQP